MVFAEGFILILSLIFSGSEGKLTVTEHRIGLLSGIGNLSYHAVTGSSTVHSLSADVAAMFIPLLQQEGE